MNKEKIHKRNKRLYWLLELVSAVLPYCIWLLIKRDEYFTTTNTTISMAIGGVLCLVFFALATLDKLQFLKGIGAFIAVGVLSWLLAPAMNDLTWISIIGGAGYIVSLVFKRLRIKEEKYCDAYIVKEACSE